MSQWTHVSGMIIVDPIHSLIEGNDIEDCPMSLGVETSEERFDYHNPYTEKELEEYFKKVDDNWKAAEASGIPCGSEGSLRWDWNPNGYYAIYGNLRDFGDSEIIVNWIKDIKNRLEIKSVFIRQINIMVDVGGELPMLITTKVNENYKEEVQIYRVTKHGDILFGSNK